MTTRGQINSNFYQIVNVDANGNPTSVKSDYVPQADNANTAGTVTTSAQPNITSLGTLSGLTSSGNITAPYFIGNVVGNITGNLVVPGVTYDIIYNNDGNAGASDNLTFNFNSNVLTVIGNVTSTNANLGNLAVANYFSGSGNLLSNIQVGNVAGLGNIATINLDGSSSNVLYGNGVFAGVTAATANYANYAGNVTIAAQANITSVGNLVNLQFNNTVTPITANVGQMFWDTGEHTVSLGMENGVTQQIGLESYVYVKASSAITDGQVVMFTGANGNNVLAAPANAASVGFKPEYIIGIATQDIALNGFGYITVFGQVHGLNTNAYTVGDILWYDSTSTTGGLTNVQPTDPLVQVQVAAVTKKSAGDGHIQVRIDVLGTLSTLTDVTITTPTAGQALIYGGANVWVNGNPNVANYASFANVANIANSVAVANVSGIGNIATVNLDGNVSNVLSGTGTWISAGGGGTPAGTNTQVQFNNAGAFGASANLTYDTVNNLLIVGTAPDGAGGIIKASSVRAGDFKNQNNYTILTSADPTSGIYANVTFGGSVSVTGTGNIANLATTKYNETVVAGGSVSGTITPDVATGTIFNYTLTGNVTINSLANVASGSGCTLILTQGGAGSYTLTSSMLFLGGAKTLSTSVGAVDILSVFYDGTTYYATLGKGYA